MNLENGVKPIVVPVYEYVGNEYMKPKVGKLLTYTCVA